MKNTLILAVLVVSLGLAGCEALKQDGKREAPAQAAKDDGPSAQVPPERLITSQTPVIKAYRKVGATYIYKTYPKRIYKGKIPPLVYAVVVTETDIDSTGKVTGVYFSRTPSHAPEVAPMIEKLIRDASPLPNPGKVGGHTYVDTWLWDKSGQFQLDTLTLGQRNR